MPKSKRHSQQKQLNTFEPVNLTLTPRGREILGLLGAGNPPSKVADAIGVTKPAITYWDEIYEGRNPHRRWKEIE